MTIFEAKPVDVRKERLRSIAKVTIVLLVLVGAAAAFFLRHWPEEHTVNRFFVAIEHKDMEKAYGIWMADPQWKQHPDKFSNYGYGQFELDWGPASEYGTITSHKVEGAVEPESKGSPVTGVVVVVTINDRAEPACLWVEKSARTMAFSPFACRK